MELVWERTVGYRTIMGTNHPIIDTIHRNSIGRKRPVWLVTYGLCNGIPEGSRTFRTKWEALHYVGDFSLDT